MRIGILTYYRVANFGANLQAISTYKYLEKHGHTPIMIHYMSSKLYERTDVKREIGNQIDMHLSFVDKYMPNQTNLCFTVDDINSEIIRLSIDAVIVGADAVLQHHPLITRLYVGGRKMKRIKIKEIEEERVFPNLFWGIGISQNLQMVMMSVSSQNSKFPLFDPITKLRMRHALRRFMYITVRDEWTQQFMKAIGKKNIAITPDPVFAFNQNAKNLVPSKKEILDKFHLPEKYLLVSFMEHPEPCEPFFEINKMFQKVGITCVALPSPSGCCMEHNYDISIPLPLSPIDWYAMIAYSQGYIGNNMHPIIVALHNCIPCICIDNYLLYEPIDYKTSKIYDLFKRFGIENCYIKPSDLKIINAQTIYETIMTFPIEHIREENCKRELEYNNMMSQLLNLLVNHSTQ